MLVLTRKIGEAIQIGDQVSIEVLEVRGGRVRLGITAPRDVNVQRSELVIPVESLSSVEAPWTAIRQVTPSTTSERHAVAISGT